MSKKLTLQEAEELLEKSYKGKICSFTYPGYDTVAGMVDDIAIDTRNSEVVLQINNTRYSVSMECFTECIKILRQ